MQTHALLLTALGLLVFQIGSALANPERIIRVAQDGRGQFRIVQAAIDSLPEGVRKPVTIAIARGIHREVAHVPRGRRLLTLQEKGFPQW